MNISVGGIKDISTIDYPGEVVSVLFLCGCPLKCPFCQNWTLLDYKNCEDTEISDIILKLKDYSDFVNGVCITGGEPTLQEKGLIEFLNQGRDLGLLKLDTNGFFPNVIEKILKMNLLSYIALDIKTRFEPIEYGIACGLPDSGEKIIEQVKKSIELILNEPSVFLEVRTTIVPNLIDKKEQIEEIVSSLSGVKRFVLQQFRPEMGTLDPNFKDLSMPSHLKMLELAKIAKKYIKDIRIRTLLNGEEII
ncbi:MAG: anaerobic ribonucleoside-triphosphate reductase activating protein [Candidatus Helarchaeota archaeon]|nr:anaerobic ribonucleoside-triphosphate reductase activating protein [Candidatus Helarchaeota archaeon]